MSGPNTARCSRRHSILKHSSHQSLSSAQPWWLHRDSLVCFLAQARVRFRTAINMLVEGLRLLQPSIARRIRIAGPCWRLGAKELQLRMASTFPDLPIFRAIASHDPHSTAIIHSRSARRFTYGELLKDVEDAKVKLFEQLKSMYLESIGGQRVAFLVENGYDYVGANSNGIPMDGCCS